MTWWCAGQAEAKQRLLEYLVTGERIHSVAIVGKSGSGKTHLANGVALSLLCQNRPKHLGGCGQCQDCRCFEQQTHPDFLTLKPSAKGQQSVDAVRELLNEVSLAPQISRCKVFVIDLDDITVGGQNALLKSLEEPPETVYFILTANSEKTMLPTVQSRVVSVHLGGMADRELSELGRQRGLQYDRAFEAQLLQAAGGNPGLFLQLAQSDWYASMQQKASQFAELALTLNDYDFMTQGMTLFKEEKDHVPELIDTLLFSWRRLAQINSKLENSLARVTVFVVEALNRKAVPLNYELWVTWLLLGLRKDLK